jgi:hypothetical protein
MMLVRGAYDYLDENVKRLAAARTGVEALGYVFTADGNLELKDDRFHQAEAALVHEVERLRVQTELTRAVQQRFEEKAREDIAAHPEKYVNPDKPGKS